MSGSSSAAAPDVDITGSAAQDELARDPAPQDPNIPEPVSADVEMEPAKEKTGFPFQRSSQG